MASYRINANPVIAISKDYLRNFQTNTIPTAPPKPLKTTEDIEIKPAPHIMGIYAPIIEPMKAAI